MQEMDDVCWDVGCDVGRDVVLGGVVGNGGCALPALPRVGVHGPPLLLRGSTK